MAPTPEDIRAQYGFVAMLAQAIPEIGALMQQAVNEQWTPERFQMSVANTNWWKTTPAALRQWVTTQYADPATATQSLADGGYQMGIVAGDLGLRGALPLPQLQDIWLYAKLHGFDDAQTRAYLVEQAGAKMAGMPEVGGEFGKWMSDFRKMGLDYGFKPEDIDRELQNRAVTAWGGGTGDLAGWQQKLMNYASAKYAPFADRIRAGETVRDIAQPYIDTYSQILEMNPEDVSLDDTVLQKWMQGRSEAGQPPVATPVWQAAQELRTDPRWGYTQNARQAAAQAATTIGRAFGMIG